VIFEQIPGLVNATAKSTLNDVTTGKDVAGEDRFDWPCLKQDVARIEIHCQNSQTQY